MIASCSAGRSPVTTTTATSSALCRNGMASAKARADSRLPFQIHRAIGTQRHKGIGGARLAGSNIGDVVSQHIEPPDLDWPLKLCESPGQQRLSLVASLARPVRQFGRG